MILVWNRLWGDLYSLRLRILRPSPAGGSNKYEINRKVVQANTVYILPLPFPLLSVCLCMSLLYVFFLLTLSSPMAVLST